MYTVIEETENGDGILGKYNTLFEAENALLYYLNHGHDAYILF
jgi:hypothetical protein